MLLLKQNFLRVLLFWESRRRLLSSPRSLECPGFEPQFWEIYLLISVFRGEKINRLSSCRRTKTSRFRNRRSGRCGHVLRNQMELIVQTALPQLGPPDPISLPTIEWLTLFPPTFFAACAPVFLIFNLCRTAKSVKRRIYHEWSEIENQIYLSRCTCIVEDYYYQNWFLCDWEEPQPFRKQWTRPVQYFMKFRRLLLRWHRKQRFLRQLFFFTHILEIDEKFSRWISVSPYRFILCQNINLLLDSFTTQVPLDILTPALRLLKRFSPTELSKQLNFLGSALVTTQRKEYGAVYLEFLPTKGSFRTQHLPFLLHYLFTNQNKTKTNGFQIAQIFFPEHNNRINYLETMLIEAELGQITHAGPDPQNVPPNSILLNLVHCYLAETTNKNFVSSRFHRIMEQLTERCRSTQGPGEELSIPPCLWADDWISEIWEFYRIGMQKG